ncbi:hypothetical protein ABZ770_31750 [Streptomyces sp. NPDC006654]|uniref:hypothetical protein n=1 Tax=unclassified Streptomyces TaxID=2593676 RepID=UPI0034021C91
MDERVRFQVAVRGCGRAGHKHRDTGRPLISVDTKKRPAADPVLVNVHVVPGAR